MLFHEIYGSYYAAVGAILREALRAPLTDREVTRIVAEKAFAESVTTIPAALKSQRQPLLDGEGKTPLQYAPDMPLTILQKRWLKALLLDPRIALFSPDPAGLEHVQPLYTPDMVVFFDRYADADPYTDPGYIEHFHTLLTALREKRRIRIRFQGRRGRRHTWACIPYRLEYSEKDDKFRLVTALRGDTLCVNLARILSAELLQPYAAEEFCPPQPRTQTLVLELTDERNALERVMLQFSHLEKAAERLDEKRYRLTLTYDRDDETEMVIRVLSFGPVLKAVSPEHFVGLIRERLKKQAVFESFQ